MPSKITKQQEKQLKKLGARIREIRQEKGMSLQDLAHSIDKDKQSISRVELGQSNPTFIYLTEVCKGLGIELSELVQGL
ncbi:MAG: helix-turn-helix transcriptional regulator [Chitinophagales bacterium]|nr:helix-turn-helix transcriptional regulator [Chitinophagales bacterium]